MHRSQRAMSSASCTTCEPSSSHQPHSLHTHLQFLCHGSATIAALVGARWSVRLAAMAVGLAAHAVVGSLASAPGQKATHGLGDVRGLRVPSDRMALKSAFNNGGGAFSAAVAMPELAASAPPRITMRAAAKTAYICQDCGYIYNDRKPFESLSSDYSCPVCLAPKRRFKVYDAPVARNANDLAVRKARKEDLKKANDAIGQALPIGIAVGLLAIVGTFLYLNSTV